MGLAFDGPDRMQFYYRFLLCLGVVPMTGFITLVVSGLCVFGVVLFIMCVIPVAYAFAYSIKEEEQVRINNNLKIARTNKILADHEVLESRRAKLDSEVAILELRVEEKRRNLGLDIDFHPTNYN